MRLLAVAVGLLFLAGCFPAGQVITSGPWKGCTASADGTSIECDWAAPVERGGPMPGEPVVNDNPVITPIPMPPIPDVPPTPAPDPEPEPDPPIVVPPPVIPDPTPDDPVFEPCKPGWGWGSPHKHCGPPGHDRPHPVKGGR